MLVGPSTAFLASFPGLQSPNAVEGLVKLVRRVTSGGRLEVWHFRWTAVLCMHGAISHASRRPPDIILRTSFTRPSTTLGDWRPGNEATAFLASPGTNFDVDVGGWGHWSMLYKTSILVFRVREHPQTQHYYKVQRLLSCMRHIYTMHMCNKVHLWCLLYAGVHFMNWGVFFFACIVTHLANQNVFSPCRLLGHSRPGEIQQYASLVLPPGSCMHPGTHIDTYSTRRVHKNGWLE